MNRGKNLDQYRSERSYRRHGRTHCYQNLLVPNIWEDNLNEPDPPREYMDLEKILDFEGFDFRLYRTSEVNILQPQLVLKGYTNIEWLPGETDSFGPLTRVCKAKNLDGETVWFIYG